MFFPAVGDAVANNQAGIADRFRDRQDLELGQGKVAERVEIVHLAAYIKEGMLGAVRQSGGADDHSVHVVAWAGNAVRGARRAAERSQVGNGVTQLRFRSRGDEKEHGKKRCEAEVGFVFHGGGATDWSASGLSVGIFRSKRKEAVTDATSSARGGITR
jgi:hypothetical protein